MEDLLSINYDLVNISKHYSVISATQYIPANFVAEYIAYFDPVLKITACILIVKFFPKSFHINHTTVEQ